MRRKFKKAFIALFFVGLIVLPALVLASISQGFISDEGIDGGSIVSFDAERPDYVVKANTSNTEDLLGIVAPEDGALLSTSSEERNIDVITTGEAFVLVSTLNGPIETGDKITPSPISGVGMKAVLRVKAIGTAQEPFNGEGENVQNITIIDTGGEAKNVAVGIVRAHISMQEYIPEAAAGSNPFFSALQDAAQSVTGQSVSLARTLISSGVMISTLVVVVMILMGATQGTMISLGRNPLAKRTIFTTMIKFVSVSVFIFVGGIIAAYLILVS